MNVYRFTTAGQETYGHDSQQRVLFFSHTKCAVLTPDNVVISAFDYRDKKLCLMTNDAAPKAVTITRQVWDRLIPAIQKNLLQSFRMNGIEPTIEEPAMASIDMERVA